MVALGAHSTRRLPLLAVTLLLLACVNTTSVDAEGIDDLVAPRSGI